MGRTEAHFKIGGRDLILSNLEKVLYPEAGFTKGQVIDYYANIAPFLLPHLKDRPLTLKRYPNGVESDFFYEKRAPAHRPDWIKTARVPSDRDPTGHIDYCLVNDLASLVWAANLADLELHPFLAQKKDVECPTQIMVDLDPGPPADATDCAQVAIWIRDLLENLGLKCWVKSSGSKGLQLHIPLNTPTSYDITKPFAHAMAEALRDAHPDRIVSDQKKTLRTGKVLIDWSQNDSSKTTICAYSLRAKSRPFVAAPLEWKEVEACLKKDDPNLVFFDSEQMLKRAKKKGDLFAPLLTLKQKLPKNILEQLSGAAAESAQTASKSTPKKSSPMKQERPSFSTEGEGLSRYNAKRDFHQTREPSGKIDKTPSKAALFVIQKHDASHLHYDFRLAMGGVLKSWAVPKSIPTTKGEKHLAVEVEDHPMDYARFEGIIPQGNYGGGTVMVWDIGTYQLLGGEPLQAWREGMLHFALSGTKLKGEWSLIRTRQQSGKNHWLLLKSGADTRAISKKMDDTSALTKRSMAQIAQQKKATWLSNRDDKSKSVPGPAGDEADSDSGSKEDDPPAAKPLPSAKGGALLRRFVEPMKCLPVKTMPEGAAWRYELKFDGYRALTICRRGEVELVSRNRKSFNERFPSILQAVARLPIQDAILDGEIVALDEHNRPSFQVLQNYESGPLAYYLFDLLALDGEDWTNRPLHERKARLQQLLKDVPAPLLFSADLEGKPAQIWEQIRAQKLEGIIAKKRDSIYEPGHRSGAWSKIKAINQQEFVIGGYTDPQGSRSHFGALLVGVHEENELRFCAKVGTGFNRAGLAALEKRMAPLKVKKCPFSNLPAPRTNRWGGGVTASEMKSCTWIEPILVCEVEFTEWTGDNSLRHPAFLGLREDVPASAVHRERPV